MEEFGVVILWAASDWTGYKTMRPLAKLGSPLLVDFMTMKDFAPYAVSLAKEVCSKHAQEILFFAIL